MTIKPDNILISDYIYTLPDERIAKYPLNNRSESKLLVYKGKSIQQTKFTEIGYQLPNSSILVFNNTKVIQARMIFQKSSGAKIEIFCLEPYLPIDYNLNFQSTSVCQWKCIVGNLKRWKTGDLIKDLQLGDTKFQLQCRKIEPTEDGFIIEFSWDSLHIQFSDILALAGELPIPPYLNRKTEEIDQERYQTAYSKIDGSVAAPTAGLHFTSEIISDLQRQGSGVEEITLHVGAGTFKPVKTETIAEHSMHEERFVIHKSCIKRFIENEQKIVCVGTTSMRTMESIYWLGVKIQQNLITKPNEFIVNQWDPYTIEAEISFKEALSIIYNFLEEHNLDYLEAFTQIIIVPGYQFRVVDGLITNFHQPQSTLLLLVAAFIGTKWKEIYEYALENDFRFLSYGDSSYLER
jgi:S-adenosylmethionine:tRNA ribosyltransferase-isomerase